MSLLPTDTRVTYGGLFQHLTVYDHVVEIGAGDGASSEGLRYCTHARQVTLYEPNPLLWTDLARAAAGLRNVTVRPEAVSDIGGTYPFYHLGYASYLAGDPSFYATSIDAGSDEVLRPLLRPVPVVTVNQAVPEDVDHLILTIGGGEERLLRAMTARPQVIQTKHYLHNARQWHEARSAWDVLQRRGYVARQTATNQHATFMALHWSREREA